MKTRIRKWGNSMGVRIPKAFVEELGLDEESDIEITLKKDKLVISAIQRRASLDELLEGITAKNMHKSIDTGGSRGKELL